MFISCPAYSLILYLDYKYDLRYLCSMKELKTNSNLVISIGVYNDYDKNIFGFAARFTCTWTFVLTPYQSNVLGQVTYSSQVTVSSTVKYEESCAIGLMS